LSLSCTPLLDLVSTRAASQGARSSVPGGRRSLPEHYQRVVPVFADGVVKHLRVKWLAFRRWWCMALTELLPKRVQDGPIGLLIRWLVVRSELYDASEQRLVA